MDGEAGNETLLPSPTREVGAVAKKKTRVPLRKNRKKRTRANDLTQAYLDDAPAASAPGSDRVRPRGDQSRHRTIIEDDSACADSKIRIEPESRRAVNPEVCLRGIVIESHGLLSTVRTEDGATHSCHVRNMLKSLAIDGRGVITVGDRVWFRPGSHGGAGLIEKVEPRSGVIARGYRRRKHLIAANVNQVLIVSALAEPELKLGFIDRYIISAESGGVRPVIVLNKADLVDLARYQWVIGLYAQLGYETIATSIATGRGLDQIRTLLASGVSAVAGQSGVGKSSLLNAIQPGLNLRVAHVSEWNLKGRHTTTSAKLLHLETGGFVVDTPGLRQFELWGLNSGQIEEFFIEFRPYVPHCRFPDCSHTHETGCAVKLAIHDGQIHPSRYNSYRKLLTEDLNQD